MNYAKLVTADSFVGRYMAYMDDTETATAYDFWTALWLLSLACGRQTVVDRPRAPVFLNLYLILVAESGVTRKSSSVRQASKIANQFLADYPRIGFIENKTTPERLDDVLHQRSIEHDCGQVAIAISELATFLGVEKYAAAMPALLTDLYDCPAIRAGGGTISRGQIRQERVWVNFLSASTPAWLHRSVHPNVVEGGFTSRCMFIVADEPKARIAWPLPRTDIPPFAADIEAVRKQSRTCPQITLNEAAIRTFSAWYRSRQLHADAFRSSFESREDAHILRVAALLSINDGTWLVQRQHVLTATRIVADVKESSTALFEGTGSRSKWILGTEAMRDVLLAAGTEPISRSALFLRVRRYLDNSEFTAMLDTMHESGIIRRFESKHEGAGRPVELIQATPLIRSKGLIDRLATVR